MIEFHDLSPVLKAFVVAVGVGYVILAIGVVAAFDLAGDAFDRSMENLNRIAGLKRRLDREEK